jgi:hypothetical protein
VLLLSVVAFSQSPNSVPGQLAHIQSKIDSLTTQVTSLTAQVASLAANNKGPRKFYETKDSVDGAHALTACAAGYHMASLWEIFDPSNLRYNTNLGMTSDDSGFGPPNTGWIRTGQRSNGGTPLSPGFNNCNAWTAADSLNNGTAARLDALWSTTVSLLESPHGQTVRQPAAIKRPSGA